MRRLLPALLALTVLAGCGGADSSLLATAVRNTEDAGGAELAFEMRMELPGFDEPLVMTGSGVEDAGRRRGHLTFDMSALARLPGAGAVCGDDCRMEAISDGSSLYMRSALFSSVLGGREWVKLDLERFGDGLGIPIGGSAMAPQSPSAQLRMIGGASGDVTNEGREDVRGTETTHYSTTVDLKDSVDALPEAQREAARRGIEMLIEATGQERIPFDIWIDDDDRVRRFEMEQDMEQGGIEVKMHVTLEYVRFGVPVDIDVPDDGEVFDATDVALQQLGQSLP
jgi:hypothetical protein